MNGRPAYAQPMKPVLCDHKQNPVTCLTCYHQRGRAPTRQQQQAQPPQLRPDVQDAIDAAKGIGVARAFQGPPSVAQGPQALVPAAAAAAPVQQMQALAGSQSNTNQGGALVLEPYRSEQKMPWGAEKVTMRVGDAEVEIDAPPRRGSLIDSLPQHPHLGQSVRH